MRTEAWGWTGIGFLRRRGSGGLDEAIGGTLERGDVDPLHPHHRVESALGSGGIGAADEPRKLPRHNLPGEAIAILDPAALLGLRHGRQRVAQAVDLGLRLNWNLERHRLIELKERPAVETREGLPHQGELDHQHIARLAGWIIAR